jgi:hypothetical protein
MSVAAGNPNERPHHGRTCHRATDTDGAEIAGGHLLVVCLWTFDHAAVLRRGAPGNGVGAGESRSDRGENHRLVCLQTHRHPTILRRFALPVTGGLAERVAMALTPATNAWWFPRFPSANWSWVSEPFRSSFRMESIAALQPIRRGCAESTSRQHFFARRCPTGRGSLSP